jgi:hypothetical protein
MNLERAAMMGELAQMKLQSEKLRNRIRGIAGALRVGLNTIRIAPEDLDIPVISEQNDQLTEAWGELITLKTKITDYERELC